MSVCNPPNGNARETHAFVDGICTDCGARESLDRNTAIKRIRAALKKRSGKDWSVTGGRGTAYGWITIDAPPRRCRFYFDGEPLKADDFGSGYMSPADRAELGQLLGLEGPAHHQGVSIAASSDYRSEYVARAEGRTPTVIGQPYWD